MEIDKQKEFTPCRSEIENNLTVKAYSDCNTIMVMLYIQQAHFQKGSDLKLIITKKRYSWYKEMLQDAEITAWIDQGDIQEAYNNGLTKYMRQ